MNRGDLQTFYPNHVGSGLNESGFCCGFTGESSFDENNDPDLDDSKDDQEDTETPENEHIDPTLDQPVSDEQLPCFREEVRKKKRELKAQYGKGKFNVLPCGIKPARAEYNPFVVIDEVKICVGWGSPGCDKKCLGVCCGSRPCVNYKTITEGNRDAYNRATERYSIDMGKWNACKAQAPFWQSGWRKEWRKFKKAGGLNEIKQRTVRCVFGQATGTEPINTSPLSESQPVNQVQEQQQSSDSGLNCSQLASKYNISGKGAWGSAPVDIRYEWINKGCKPKNAESPSANRGFAPGEAPTSNNNKKMIIIAIVAVVVIVGLALMVNYFKNKK